MHSGRKLWSIFGPVILAFALVLILFSLPIKNKHSLQTEKQAAVSLSPIVFKNQSIKKQALSDHNAKFVPFFGSSELRRMDRYHPSVMAPGTITTPPSSLDPGERSHYHSFSTLIQWKMK